MTDASAPIDPRIHCTAAHLRSLGARMGALDFLPRQPARSALNGRHASRMRGRGLSFEEIRGYLAGDDVRSIDWKVTARTREPHVRVYTEERDRPALIVVDQRMSMFFGSVHALKSVTAAESAAIAAHRILAVGDRIGGIVFDDENATEIRPQRSRRALHALLEAIAAKNLSLRADKVVRPSTGALNRYLEMTARIARHNHLVIVASDFDGVDERTEVLLRTLASHNDVVLLLVHDPSAEGIADGGRFVATDGEAQIELDTTDAELRSALQRATVERLERILAWRETLRVSVLPLSSGEEVRAQLPRLLGHASRRAR